MIRVVDVDVRLSETRRVRTPGCSLPLLLGSAAPLAQGCGAVIHVDRSTLP